MEGVAALKELVRRLNDFPRGDRYEVGPAIFAKRPWNSASPAVVLNEEALDGVAPSKPEYTYLLEVSIAREVLDVWSNWRGGQVPTADEAVEAIIHYAVNDAYQPVD